MECIILLELSSIVNDRQHQIYCAILNLFQHGKQSASDKDGLSKEQRLARDAKVSS